VRIVFFDLDGTLIFHKPDTMEILSDFCAGIGQHLQQEQLRHGRRVRHEYFADPLIREELDGLPREEFWHHYNRHLLEAMGIEGDLDALADELAARFERIELDYDCPNAGCRTLDVLRNRGYRLGLITNREHVPRFHALIEEANLRHRFEIILSSGEVGMPKPQPTIFHAALAQAGARAEDAIYVGDNYWADVVGAQRAGVRPVLLDPHGLFPEAECIVIERIDALLRWLPGPGRASS
jgi:putative hydrolase of the HAD superfamily